MSTELQRYFCHQCHATCLPTPPDYTCPTCNDGFIEPMTSPVPRIHPSLSQPLAADIMGPGSDVNMGILVREMLQPLILTAQARQAQLHRPPNNQQAPTPNNDEQAQQSSRNSGGGVSRPHRIHTSNSGHIRRSPFQNMRGMRIGMRGARDGGDGRLQFDGYNDVPTLFSQIVASLTDDTQMVGNPGDYAWGPAGLDNIISQLIGQLDGSGPPPAHEDSIDQLPDVYVPKKFIDDSLDCTVCQEYFLEDVKVKELPCKHYFHVECIVPWLKLHNSCPVCRVSIDGTSNEPGNVEMPDIPTGNGPDVAVQQPATTQTAAQPAIIHEDDLD